MATERIHIFHTNDLHSDFTNWPNIVSHIKKNRTDETIYFDIGDHVDRVHPFSEATLGKGNVQLLNEAKVDYATIGNNEGITLAKEQLDELYDEATFPIVLANLFDENGERPKWAKESMIHTTKNGTNIGIVGITAQFAFFYEQLGWQIERPEIVLAEILPKLKEQVDIIILLSHVGLFKDEEIAEKFTEIDLILGSHTHHVLEEGKRINDTLIAQTGKLGAFLGEVVLKYDQEQKEIVESAASLIVMDEGKSDKKTVETLQKLASESDIILSEKVARVPRTLHVNWQEETEASRLLCEAVTDWCGEKIGMIHAGVLLETIKKGWVTKGDIHRICPHPINPCVVKMTGEQLKKTIELAFTKEIRYLQLKGFGFRGKILGRMIFTGIGVQLNQDQSVEKVFVLGKEIEHEKIYSVATLDMYTFGYLFPDVAAASEKKYMLPYFLRDILTWKIKKLTS